VGHGLLYLLNSYVQNDMDKIVKKIPTWALPMLVNADPSGLTDEDIELVENWCDATTCKLFATPTTV
jgi:hypothetical protein